MIDFSVDVRIGRAADDVFAYVTDPGLLHTWQVNTVSATPEPTGPVRLGTRLREVHRAPGGRELASVVEVVEYEPSRVFALKMLEGSLLVDGRFTFEPDGDGTRVTLHGRGTATGAMRLLQPVLRRVLRRQFAQDLERLRVVLEAGST